MEALEHYTAVVQRPIVVDNHKLGPTTAIDDENARSVGADLFSGLGVKIDGASLNCFQVAENHLQRIKISAKKHTGFDKVVVLQFSDGWLEDRKSTRLNSSHRTISY